MQEFKGKGNSRGQTPWRFAWIFWRRSISVDSFRIPCNVQSSRGLLTWVYSNVIFRKVL